MFGVVDGWRNAGAPTAHRPALHLEHEFGRALRHREVCDFGLVLVGRLHCGGAKLRSDRIRVCTDAETIHGLCSVSQKIDTADFPAFDEEAHALNRFDAEQFEAMAGLPLRIDTGAAEVQLQPVKPCARCPIPNIDPATAESSPAVGDMLRSYRQDRRLDGAITFGMSAIVCQGAGQMLRVGQAVAADLCFD